MQDREQQLNQSENEIKLDRVQQRFPNENLNLDQPIDVIEVHVHTHTHSFSTVLHVRITSDMQGMMWGEPELPAAWKFMCMGVDDRYNF